MEAMIVRVPEACVVIKNWFTPEEIEEIFKELEAIRKMALMDAKDNSSAKHEGQILKKGKGVFLDVLYPPEERHRSPILRHMNKIYDRGLISALSQQCSYFEQIEQCDQDHTLANYYVGGDEYKQHKDQSVYTACAYLWKEPKKFTGGNFYLRDTMIEVENNMMVMFPGFVKHSATLVEMDNTEENAAYGRWSIARFLNYK